MNTYTNTTLIKLPFIIEYDIIELILDYLINDCSCDSELYETKISNEFINYLYYKNQIIKLSIVCKRWFNRISNTISNSIIESLKHDDNSIGKWFNYYTHAFKFIELEILKSIILKSNKKKSNKKKINNNNWSLIKIDISIINEFYNSILVKSSYEPNSNDYLNKKNVVLIINGSGGQNEFELLFNNRKLISPSVFKILNNSCLKINEQFELLIDNKKRPVVPLVFDSICIDSKIQLYGELFKKGLLKTRNLTLSLYNNNQQSLELLSKICCDSNSNDNLKFIQINLHDIIDYGVLKYLNNMLNLETLYLSILFNQLYNKLYNNTTTNTTTSEDSSIQIKQGWETMIESLSNNKYIKRLILNVKNYDSTQYDLKGIEIISNGIKQILESNKSIKYLMLDHFNSFPPSLWSGLISNQTLKTLILKYSNNNNTNNLNLIMDYLFSTLFNVDTHSNNNNQSQIRHFILKTKFKSSFTTQILQLLINYPNSSLYSITFEFDLENHFNLLIDLLSLPNLTINQFNLIVCKGFNIKKFYKLTKIKNLNNNKIINVKFEHNVFSNSKNY